MKSWDEQGSPTPPRKRLTREESRALTREHLLDAAKRLFAERGFEGTSVDQVAEAAGYTKGAFYSNFEGKEDLLLALIERCVDEDVRAMAAYAERARREPALDLAAGFQESADASSQNRLAHLLKMEFWMCALRYPRARAVYAVQIARLREAMGGLVEGQYQALGIELPAPPEEMAAAIIALGNGLDTQRLVSPDAFSASLYATVVKLLVAGSAAEPEGR